MSCDVRLHNDTNSNGCQQETTVVQISG